LQHFNNLDQVNKINPTATLQQITCARSTERPFKSPRKTYALLPIYRILSLVVE